MADVAPKTRTAVRELIALLETMDEKFIDGDEALHDEASQLEVHRWIFTTLQVALDTQVWADGERPRFVDIVGPYKKWGGDNVDAFYQHTPIDPRRTYRITGRPGDAVYWSFTIYGGPNDGRYSERIVGSVNDRDVPVADDGTITFTVSPDPFDGPGIRTEPDAVAGITRDYLDDWRNDERMTWHIECLDGAPDYVQHDADVARRFHNAITWLKEQTAMAPVWPGDPNEVQEPYPVPTETFGWAAGDASYAMGRFSLTNDEALVIEGRSPECAFWNLCLWNSLLHTYNYDYDQVSVNGSQVRYEDDGSWRIVVSAHDPGLPNWVSTQGHTDGLLWFRWFLPDHTPERPTTRIVSLADLAGER